MSIAMTTEEYHYSKLGYIVKEAWPSVQNSVSIHEVDDEKFHRGSENFDLLVALVEKSGDHQRY